MHNNMKHIKLFEQFEMSSLYEEINSIMGGELSEAEIQDMLNEGFFSWLKNIFSNPKKKRELDELAKKLVQTRVDVAKIDIEKDNVEEFEAQLDPRNDPYNPNNDSRSVKPTRKAKDSLDLKKKTLTEYEANILAKMDALAEENETLKKYVNKVKLDSRIEATEQIMKLADKEIARVLSKVHRNDTKMSKDLNKELQKVSK